MTLGRCADKIGLSIADVATIKQPGKRQVIKMKPSFESYLNNKSRNGRSGRVQTILVARNHHGAIYRRLAVPSTLTQDEVAELTIAFVREMTDCYDPYRTVNIISRCEAVLL